MKYDEFTKQPTEPRKHETFAQMMDTRASLWRSRRTALRLALRWARSRRTALRLTFRSVLLGPLLLLSHPRLIS